MKAVGLVALSFGVCAGLLGLEHGAFEAMQGNVTPSGPYINAIGSPCQQATAWHACEPAFTIVPDFLVTGLLSMALAIAILVWAARFLQRSHGTAVLFGLVVALFLVGGGFVTLIFGLIATIASSQARSSHDWWRAHLPPAGARFLTLLWPWVLIAYLASDVASWVVGSFANGLMLTITPVMTAMMPFLLVLILVVSLAHDIGPEQAGGARPTA